jgi:hypothetical protein
MTAILVCVAIFLIVVVVTIAEKRAFEERFPPISDAEFLARCPPGTNPAVALKVRRIVAKHFAVEYERVYPSTSFIEDLGAD